MTKLTDLQKKAIFRDLATVSKHQAGLRAGLDKYYKNRGSIITTVDNIMKEVRVDPDRFAVSQDVIEMVEKALKERGISRIKIVGQTLPVEAPERLEDLTMEQLVERGGKKALIGLNKSIDYSIKTKASIMKISPVAWGKVAGILFDKTRIVRGEATEHVVMKAQISEDLTASQKLDLILKMRERQTINKDD